MTAAVAHDRRMKHWIVLLALACATPAVAQEPAPPAPEEEEEGFSLMERGAQLLFRGLMQEMEPALSEMEEALAKMEPKLRELMALVDDLRNYDAPRRLENGDILIPRRPDAPPPPALPAPEEGPASPPQGETEL